jgi:8-oxo-dGTP pyrophosphatase MutT (NUDIX family)
MSRARIVAAVLHDRHRMLLCHRSPHRRWYPDVWDLPGGHVDDGESPGAALVRELREELGIVVAEPVGPPLHRVGAETFDLSIWSVETWTGTPVNLAPEEHDAIGWFTLPQLDDLRLAHHGYRETFAGVLKGTD